ncbi:hypothetical protein KBC55_01200 [Patescibacteria group bacterium]|jgi:tyrosine-specific transport protein|nr:hypothetical protein [Patescibacteria group bacterium]
MAFGRFPIFEGAKPLIGSVVGVGIFGLPFAINQAGSALGFLVLLAIGGLNMVTLLAYGDLLLARSGHGRFISVVEHELGLPGKVLATIAFFGSLWGAMVAYIVLGGTFIFDALHNVIPVGIVVWQSLFFMVAATLLIGGLSLVTRLQSILIPVFALLLALLVGFAAPHLDVANITFTSMNNPWLIPSVALFAFSGLAAVPEMRDVLDREKRKLPKSIMLGTALIAAVYLIFSAAIIGVTGKGTTTEAIEGLRGIDGGAIVVVGFAIGAFTAFTAFLSVGTAVMNTLIFDFKRPILIAWTVAALTPFLIFLIGARDFINILSFTGGILTSLYAILILLSYERARFSGELAKHALRLPQVLIATAFFMYVAVMVMTVVG